MIIKTFCKPSVFRSASRYSKNARTLTTAAGGQRTTGTRHAATLLGVGIVSGLTWQQFHAQKPHLLDSPPANASDLRSTLPLGTFPPPNHDISPSNISAARSELTAILGATNIIDNPAELAMHSGTEWSPASTSMTASLIVLPSSTEDVSEIMKICHKRRIPVTPFSGGTSLDSALAATRGGICIDFKKMNKVIKFHKDDMDIVVQPSLEWQDLNTFLQPHGFFFPPDPGPGAEIGGMIATGCSGTNAYRYGPMRNWVISATVVLADGAIVKTRQRPRKSSAGYDLTRLIVGSSGTLGLVTEACLKIASLPQNEQVAVVSFPTTQAALNTVVEMSAKGLQTEAIELLDGNGMRLTNESGYTEREYKELPTLFIKFAGSSKENVTRQISDVQAVAKKHDSQSFEASGDPDTISSLWEARKTILWSLLAQRKHPDDKFTGSDVAVPISHLATIVEEAKEKYKAAGLVGTNVGHVGDGNFHAAIMYGEKDRDAAEKILLELRRRGIELEGTVTGEHGVGMALRDLLVEELGENAVDMMRRIKMALDPQCLLGCDKVIRIEEGPDH